MNVCSGMSANSCVNRTLVCFKAAVVLRSLARAIVIVGRCVIILPLRRTYPVPRVVILSVGNDETLLRSRNAVLRTAGYVVIEASSPRHTMAEFIGGDF